MNEVDTSALLALILVLILVLKPIAVHLQERDEWRRHADRRRERSFHGGEQS